MPTGGKNCSGQFVSHAANYDLACQEAMDHRRINDAAERLRSRHKADLRLYISLLHVYLAQATQVAQGICAKCTIRIAVLLDLTWDTQGLLGSRTTTLSHVLEYLANHIPCRIPLDENSADNNADSLSDSGVEQYPISEFLQPRLQETLL
ncbi:hypothetical protein WOLCODRAFT_154909 [Wolfiporia cocos MD-104 SS10]|uniref:Uncharacterized protein n=1 Tax=Wolfiporia cocos (strain MD-104) TaxID=742152 RepID=A0A2H3K126_WOLCO|nr:hypothetical protein WOLCODRAFT_154909 [Wolfiporia cocos MD-104 SS10]